MQNIRHFWSSIRPNGPSRPHILDRLELRICDFISEIDLLLAVTALLEVRTLSLFENFDNLDPLLSSKFSLVDLQKICDQNEINAAQKSLNAELVHWKNGNEMICKDWIKSLLEEISPTAEKYNMLDILKPIYKVLEEGNQSMQWIKKYNEGFSIKEIMGSSINRMKENEG